MERGGGTIVPSTEDIVIPAYTDTELTVQGDSELIASNIREGVELFGITGTLPEGVTGIDYGTVTPSNSVQYSLTVNHSLGTTPSQAFLVPIGIIRYYDATIGTGTKTYHTSGNPSPFYIDVGNITRGSTSVTFNSGGSLYGAFPRIEHLWVVLA